MQFESGLLTGLPNGKGEFEPFVVEWRKNTIIDFMDDTGRLVLRIKPETLIVITSAYMGTLSYYDTQNN